MRPMCAALLLAVVSGCFTGADAATLISPVAWGLLRPAEGNAVLTTVVESDAPGGGPVLHVTVNKPSEPFYATMLMQNVPVVVADGSRLRLTFWARSRTRNPLRAVVEKNGPPFDSVTDLNPTLSPEWKKYVTTGTSPAYAANGLGVRLQFGHQVGELEFTGVTLENLGQDPGLAAARAAIEPNAIAARIRKYRMGDVTVVVRDAHGRPVPKASVSVEQTAHAFLFGCNIFALQPGTVSELQQGYQKRFTDLLNYATLPFYWGGFEPQKGNAHYAQLDAMARWCKEHGIVTKGHPLVWHEVYPAWAPKDPDAAIPLLEHRVKEIVTHYKGLIGYWDVLNEANNASSYANTGEGAWIKRDGPAAVVATALGWARAASAGTHNTLIYNDFNTGDANVQLLADLQARHALPDAIGIQSHMHGGVWPLTTVWQTTERFARFGRPIHYTETTVLSGPDRPFQESAAAEFATTPDGEKRQADYVARFYSILFSHPAVRAITWWDFSDLDTWMKAPAGLVRKDMSPKPAYGRLMKLIRGDWWTRARGVSGTQGTYKLRAFYGTYRVTVQYASGRPIRRTFTLPMGSGSKTVVVELP